MKVKTLVVAAVFSICLISSTAYASNVVGEPEIDLVASDNRFEKGTDTELEVTVVNEGDITIGGSAQYEDRVTTARKLVMNVRDRGLPDGMDVKTGKVAVGDVPQGTKGPVTFGFEIGDVEPGRYRIPIELSYSYTSQVEQGTSPIFYDFSTENLEYVTVVVEGNPRFEVPSESSRVYVNDVGVLNFTLANTGGEAASDLSAELTSSNPQMFFGNFENPKDTTTVYVSRLGSGEKVTREVRVGADPDLSPGYYPVNVEVGYDNVRGVEKTSRETTTGVRVREGRRFELDLSATHLRVNEDDATIQGEVTNVGNATAYNAVVELSEAKSVEATSPESTVGNLEPYGGSHPVNFKIAVPGDAEPGSRELSFDVVYENRFGDKRTLNQPIRKSFEVEQEIDRFEVTNTETTLKSGSSATLNVTVRNNLDETVNDTTIKLFVSDPLTSSDDSAFLGRLEPNSTATGTFRVSSEASALPKQYSASIEARYRDSQRDSEFSRNIEIGIPVSESDDGLPVIYIAGFVFVAVAAVAIYIWRK